MANLASAKAKYTGKLQNVGNKQCAGVARFLGIGEDQACASGPGAAFKTFAQNATQAAANWETGLKAAYT